MALNYLENDFEISSDYYNSPFVLNKSAHAKMTDKDNIINIYKQLNLHGISTPLLKNSNSFRKLNFHAIYLIPVFQQSVLGYYKQIKNKSDTWVNSSVLKDGSKVYIKKLNNLSTKREERRVSREAIRAVYALNLDYALVKVGITAGDKPWILFVNPNPEADDQIINKFENAIDHFFDKWEQIIHADKSRASLGADPEFVLQSPTGTLVLASKYLPKNGVAGCDRIWTNRDRTQLPLAELRPSPSQDPRQLMINLYKSMLVASKRISDRQIRWLAGAMPIAGYPIGGHIHFSNIWLNSFLLRALDNYMTLLITLFEDKNGISRRPKYGFLGDYREQFHGGFEYRTLPSWLVSPTLTRGIISLSKLIAENYMYLYQNPLENINVQEAYYKGDKATLRPIVLKLWNELKQLSDFPNYEKYLLPLEQLIIDNYTWNEMADFRKAWRLPPFNR